MIPTFHRCNYELHVAQKLKVKVMLSLHISDNFIEYGYLGYDVCIANINSAVDSEKAHCSWQPDKESIHAAIKSSQSPKGFDDINASVERMWLEYLLDYPVEKVKGSYNEETDEDYSDGGRYSIETCLVPSIITMINRVHSIAADEIPKFEEYRNTLLDSSGLIAAFCQWEEVIKFLI